MTDRVDCVVVGAGVVGLAIGRAIAATGRQVLVLEREDIIGSGTSSRNSEVIHAGIYYEPGSLKARLCREGRDRLYAYCAERGIAHSRCGKLIVAVTRDQVAKLEGYRQLARLNGVEDLSPLDKGDIARLEPAVRAEAGLWSPSTGIVDSHALMLALQGDIENAGGLVVCRAPLLSARRDGDGWRLSVGGSEPMELHAISLVISAGLGAQEVAAAIHEIPKHAIPRQHLAIGHYYTLAGASPFKHLVYPATNQDGGLGVHVTLDLGGQAKFGPDARWVTEVEYTFDDSRREAFIAAILEYYPDLDRDRLQPGYTGIRPKLSGPGEPARDFHIAGPADYGVPGLVTLFGIESPGLTSSLAIGVRVAELVTAGS